VATNSVLAKLAVQISANTADFNKNLTATQNHLQRFTGNISKLGGMLGVAFGVQQLASFTFEVSKLSGEAEAVRGAFERLANHAELMEKLKQATHGTVSELDLMKRTVMAANFDISLEALPRLLEFATLRAQQTGQSVDYLVDSIVTGIGRKSKLILDNLGISAVQLTEALGGASTNASSIGEVADAVGRIAEANLKNMAKFSENAASKAEQLNASWVNFKVTLGDFINTSGLLSGGIDLISKSLENMGNVLKKNPWIVEWFKLVTLIPRKTLELLNAMSSGGGAPKTPTPDEFFNGLLAEQDAPKKIEKTTQAIDEQAVAIEKVATSLKHVAVEKSKFDDMQAAFFTPEALTTTWGDDVRTGGDFLSTLGLDPESIQARLNASGMAIQTFASSTTQVFADLAEEYNSLGEIVTSVGSSIGEAFVGALQGHEDFARGLSQVTSQIIEMYLRQSIAAWIAASIKDKTTLPIGKIALAAAGIGAIRALFSSIGSMSSSYTGAPSAPGLRPSEYNANISITGKTRGYDTVYTVDKEGYRRARVG
jgi:hypothetical protein